jgi:hypothetical protein
MKPHEERRDRSGEPEGLTLGGGPNILCEKPAQCVDIQHLLGQQLLQFGVVLLERLHALRPGNFHPAVFGFPVAKCCFRNPVLAAGVGHLRASLLLLQRRNNLLLRKSLLLHFSVFQEAEP